MKSQYSFILIGLISLVLYGCTLEEPMMGTFCGIDSDGNTNGPAYIQLDSETRCYPRDCTDLDSCCGILNNADREFAYKAFKYKRCPDKSGFSHCKNDGINDFCGSNDQVVIVNVTCQNADDCIEINPAITKAECESGFCKVLDCEQGFHVVNQKYCQIDNEEHCGSDQIKCDKSAGEICENGVCIIPKECELDENCLTNYITEAECIDYRCHVINCTDGMHVYENACESDTKDNCGSHGNQCDESKLERCINGKCSANQKEGEIFCNGQYVDPKMSKDYCGARGLCTDTDPDSENYQGEACTVIGQSCKPDSLLEDAYSCMCDEGQSVCKNILDQLQCIQDDTSQYCGCSEESSGMDCTKLKNIEQDSATCENSVCRYACLYGYADCNDNPDDGCEVSLGNDSENCSVCGNKCQKPNNADKVFCNQFLCDFSCPNNLNKCDDGCFNFNTDPIHCGNCETKCKVFDSGNSSENICQNGQCIPCKDNQTVCFDKYCADLQSDNNNCGECGYKCGNDQTCIDGMCIVESCPTGKAEISVNTLSGIKNTTAICIYDHDLFCEKIIDQNTDEVFVQMNDFTIYAGSKCPKPLSSDGNGEFSGIYLGNGKRIEVTSDETEFKSLFPRLNHATIENLKLFITFNSKTDSAVGALTYHATDSMINNVISSSNITATSAKSAGELIGTIENSTITKCKLSGSVTGDNDVGSLAGYVIGSKIDNAIAENSSSVVGNWSVGGLIGYSEKTSISNSITNNSIKADSNAGGLVGVASSSQIINNQSTSALSTVRNNGYITEAGGLIGLAESNSIITNCNAKNTSIYCNQTCGGLIGTLKDSIVSDCETSLNNYNIPGGKSVTLGGLIGVSYSSNITNSKANFTLLQTNYHSCYTGGIAGNIDKTIINNCESNGNLSTSTGSDIGGMVGTATQSSILNSKFSGNISGQATLGGFVGTSIISLLANNFVQASITCDIGSNPNNSCGGFIGRAESCHIHSNYGLIHTTVTKENTPLTYSEMLSSWTNFFVGGFIGYSTKSLWRNNYSINFDIPNFVGYFDDPLKSAWNFWYIDETDCSTYMYQCTLGSLIGKNLESSSFIQIDNIKLIAYDFHTLLLSVINNDLDTFDILNSPPDILLSQTPYISPFYAAKCNNIFGNDKESVIPVLPDLMPDNCIR